MALKILIAEPENNVAYPGKELLEKNMFSVEVAQNGKDAQIIASQHKLFAVLMNVAIQNYSIHQVLKFIRSNQSAQRIIVYAKDKKILEELELDKEKLLKLGVTEFYDHTLGPEEMRSVLEGHQSITDIVSNLNKREGQSPEVEVTGDDSKFTAIAIGEFYSTKNVLFDVFIRLGSSKYLKILHAGDAFSKERLDRYRNEKKIEHLYISTADRKKFIQWNNFLLEKTLDSKAVSTEGKVRLVKTVTDKYVEEIYTEGLKPQLIDQGKALCNNTFKLIEKEKNLYKMLKTYQDMDPTAFSHFFLVGMFSTMVVKFFEWQSQTTIETISMASLLHDIGKVKLPGKIMSSLPQNLSAEEYEIYKQHPQLSVSMLEGNRMFNNSIKQIILQHHEAADGSGFPFGLKDSSISALSKILFFTNEFVNMITFEKITPVQGVVKVLRDKEQFRRYNPFVVENFTKIFMDPEKIQKQTILPSNSSIVPTKKAE